MDEPGKQLTLLSDRKYIRWSFVFLACDNSTYRRGYCQKGPLSNAGCTSQIGTTAFIRLKEICFFKQRKMLMHKG